MNTTKTSFLVKAYLLSLLCILSICQAEAQDIKKVIEQLRQSYSSNGKMHMVLTIKAFESRENKEPVYHESAEIKKDGDNYFYVFGANHMLMNQKYLIMVDELNQQILYSQRNSQTAFNAPVQFNIDSILNFYETPIYLGMKENIGHYQLVQKTGDIKIIDLFVDTQQDVIRKLAYYYKEGQHVEITYEIFEANPVFDALAFDERRYLNISKNKKMPSPPYQEYQVLDMEESYIIE